MVSISTNRTGAVIIVKMIKVVYYSSVLIAMLFFTPILIESKPQETIKVMNDVSNEHIGIYLYIRMAKY